MNNPRKTDLIFLVLGKRTPFPIGSLNFTASVKIQPNSFKIPSYSFPLSPTEKLSFRYGICIRVIRAIKTSLFFTPRAKRFPVRSCISSDSPVGRFATIYHYLSEIKFKMKSQKYIILWNWPLQLILSSFISLSIPRSHSALFLAIRIQFLSLKRDLWMDFVLRYRK